MMLTDHYLTREQLTNVGAQIKKGDSMAYDKVRLKEWIEQLKSNPVVLHKLQHPEEHRPSLAARLGCVAIPLSVFVAIVFFAIRAICQLIFQ